MCAFVNSDDWSTFQMAANNTTCMNVCTHMCDCIIHMHCCLAQISASKHFYVFVSIPYIHGTHAPGGHTHKTHKHTFSGGFNRWAVRVHKLQHHQRQQKKITNKNTNESRILLKYLLRRYRKQVALKRESKGMVSLNAPIGKKGHY